MAQGSRAATRGRFERWFEVEVVDPMADFQNPRQEWRRLASELFGTFFLVLVAAGGGMMSQAFPETISRQGGGGCAGPDGDGRSSCSWARCRART